MTGPTTEIFGLLGTFRDKTFARLHMRATERKLKFVVADLNDLILAMPPEGLRESFVTEWLNKLMDSCNALYFRLPSAKGISKSWSFEGDAIALSRYIFLSIERLQNIQVVCGPGTNGSNSAKILHSALLADLGAKYGVLTPESLASNSYSEVIDFAIKYPETIVKGGSGAKSLCCIFAQDVLTQHFRTWGSIPPLFLQQRILGPDIRAHIVGRKKIVAEMTVSLDVDYRFSMRKHSEPLFLPKAISDFCLHVCNEFEIDLAGIDFRLDSSGTWYILEANSMPDFHGYDRRSNYSISDALLDFLTSARPKTAAFI